MAASARVRAASISFQQLRLFERLGRLQSFRKAAEECNLSQPAVTQTLAKLEQQVGATLLERCFSGSYLNDLGLLFHRRVVSLFERMENALVNLGLPDGPATVPLVVKRLVRSKVRMLIAVVENASLQQAADALDLSQASVQRGIRDLELVLQKQLCRRTLDGIAPTQAAIQFALEIKLALQEIELGITEIETLQGSFIGRISIGAMPAGGSILLASVLDEFVAAYPHIEVRIITENTRALLRSLRGGDVDFIIGLLPQDIGGDLISEPLAKTPYVIVVRRGHCLLQKRAVTLNDLLCHDWVVGLPGSSRRGCFDSLFANCPNPNPPIETASQAVIQWLLKQSDRLTIMTSYELQHEANAFEGVPFAPLDPAPEIGITRRANWQPTRIHADFIRLFKRKAAEFAGHVSARKNEEPKLSPFEVFNGAPAHHTAAA